MNTLFIIGNGFDLAHGLKTRYEDFLISILTESIITLLEQYPKFNDNTPYNNQFISFRLSDRCHMTGFMESLTNDLSNVKNIADFKSIFNNTNYFKESRYTNKIVQSCLQNDKDNNWSDIEWQYFKLLSEILMPEKGSPLIDQTPQLERTLTELNKGIDDISLQLSKYLTNIVDEFIPEIDLVEKYNKILLKHSGDENLTLNFNYTSTIMLCPAANSFEMIPIHGLLGQHQPLILGYGDETTDLYKEMENKNNFEFLRHTKSSRYAENDNYYKIHSFINDYSQPISELDQVDTFGNYKINHNQNTSVDGALYEVVILGHSCGLSDRVLLKEILDKDNCQKIHVYFYDDKKGYSDFLKTVSNISRHFDKNVDMRSKLKSYNIENRMPQHNDES